MNQKFIQLKIYNIFAKDYFLSEEEEEDQVLLSTYEKKQKSLLYPDARITVKDFSALFMGIISRLGNLPATQQPTSPPYVRAC